MIRWAGREYSDGEIFSILSEPVREWFKRKFGTFTPPQRYAVIEIHKGENVLISSPTGSGKTLSAFLSAINELILLGKEGKLEDKIYVLYVSPLRALNNDIKRNLEGPLAEIKEAAKELGYEIPEIRIGIRTSDTSSYEKSKMVRKPPHILITTPESLAIALNAPKFRERLKTVKYLIVDEVHALAENKRGSHLALSIERLQEMAEERFVRIGLSATIHPLEEVAKFVFGFENGEPRSGLIVDVSFAKQTEIRVESVVEDLIYTPAGALSEALYNRLAELIREHRTTLIFTNTRSGAERVAFNLKKRFPEFEGLIEAHHSSLSREVRLDVEEKLKRGELKAVVCVPGHTKIFTARGTYRINELTDNEEIVGVTDIGSSFVRFGGTHRIKYNSMGIKLRTRLGFEVEATREHKFLTIKDGKLIWIEAEKLKPGDYVGVLRRLPSPDEEVSIFEILPDSAYLHLHTEFLRELKENIQSKFGSIKAFARKLGISESYLSKQLRGEYPFRWSKLKVALKEVGMALEENDVEKITSDKNSYELPKRFTPRMARVLGFWLADGSWKGGTITLFSSDLDMLKHYAELAKEELGIEGSIRKQNESTYALELSFNVLLHLFKELIGNDGRKSIKGRFPEILYRLPMEHKVQFLSGYFDGDGYLEIKENGRVYSAGFVTFNSEFAEGIRTLLLQLGIVASIRRRHHNEQQFFRGREIRKTGTSYTIAILGGEYLRKFGELIEPWRSGLERIKDLANNGYSNSDVIPGIGHRLRKIREKLGISSYRLQKMGMYNPIKVELGTREISRRNLTKLLDFYEMVAKERGVDSVIPEIKELRKLAEGDVFFDKIESVESVFIADAYGVLNSETGNYVVNGFVSKNSSTSLELGIDIGTIDLVVLIGSPKSVNRALQRIGRAGHRLHEVSKGVILALDRDDLVEVTVLAHNARNRRLDRVRIPENPLDVLVQHLLGMALNKVWEVEEAYSLVRRAYPFRNLPFDDFMSVLRYLAGEYAGLEEKKVYAKIWLEDGRFGRRGKMTRAIYYMNVGTIPDEAKIRVHTMDKQMIGTVEEEFAERLMPGDIFVLAGRTYEFVKSRGNKIYVIPREGAKPTIPAWFSEMLPLSFDLALDIQGFRREVKELLKRRDAVRRLVRKYGVDERAARAIIAYFREQEKYSVIPDDETVLVEFVPGKRNRYFFHTLIGRRANDALSRAFAYLVSKKKNCNVGIAINDNGFALLLPPEVELSEEEVLELFEVGDLRETLKRALDNTELLKRRFRHVANRGLLILRRYVGRSKRLGRQQVMAVSLLKVLKENHPDFPLLKEVYREIMEDKMDVESAELFLSRVREGRIRVEFRTHSVPSPFAFNLEAIGSSDVVLMEDRRELIKQLHRKIMAMIEEAQEVPAKRS
ncbi:DEAD/DEAH box helicase [Thermococcus sp. 18S1]|uniref:DEAD/DEAH box helicase n=1 Tax=Thermococcus sp. 18S1 TaxID=1638210 RepID=UPI001438DAF0|nr:DEAD/DEAH box helicase [Thermococcus sp. 18S1]NJE30369.1 DEAD/DEAH box helicase [Thermococcus sp. 18S1]